MTFCESNNIHVFTAWIILWCASWQKCGQRFGKPDSLYVWYFWNLQGWIRNFAAWWYYIIDHKDIFIQKTNLGLILITGHWILMEENSPPPWQENYITFCWEFRPCMDSYTYLTLHRDTSEATKIVKLLLPVVRRCWSIKHTSKVSNILQKCVLF